MGEEDSGSTELVDQGNPDRGRRCGSWRPLDTALLVIAGVMILIAVTCRLTVYPRSNPDPAKHGGHLPEYNQTLCRVSNTQVDEQVNCERNNYHEWCDADGDDYHRRWKRHEGRGRRHRGRRHHARSPCMRVQVTFIYQGTYSQGILHLNWIAVENFYRCSRTECSEYHDDEEEEGMVERWRQELEQEEEFTCYYNRHKPEEVVKERDDWSCWARKPGFHAVLIPSVTAIICLVLLVTRRFCACYHAHRGTDAKVLPDEVVTTETGVMPEKQALEEQAGPLPEKQALGEEARPVQAPELVLAVPPLGPPPTYDGQCKDPDTVSMMSVPPAYDVASAPNPAAPEVVPPVQD